MALLNIPTIIAAEWLRRQPRQRVGEPSLVMDDPAQVDAYLEAGSERGSLAPIYLFNTALASALIRPGDTVLDLACGPANQLSQLAAVNPDAQFLGVDLSAEMLERGKKVVERRGLTNVRFEVADIAALACVANASVDLAMSTLSLHHLPDRAALECCFAQVRRVLKPDGRFYFSDLGGLRSETAINAFARQYASVQPDVFNKDYLNSLRAAFRRDDFQAAIHPLGVQAELVSTFLVPFMIVIRSRTASRLDDQQASRIESMRKAMPLHQRFDHAMLAFFFRLGGLALPARK